MAVQGGNRPSQEFMAGYPDDARRQQWQINPTHQDAYWYDARQNMWVPHTRENQHTIIQPEQPRQQQHVQLPQTRQPVALPSHSEHQPHTDHNREGARSLPSAEELQKNIQETKNDPLGSGTKPRKDIKTPPKQSAPAKVSKRKSTAKSKAEGNQAIAKLEDQGNWSDEDTKLLLETLLGSDSQLYEKLMVNAKYVYKKVASTVFNGRRSPESVRGRYERLRKVFSYILNFESMTGNGGGDPDVDELDDKIENAWMAGKDVGTLSGAMLKKWYVEGWYSLFNERLGEHPGLVREEEFRSGTISDAIIEIGDSNNESNKGDTSDDGFSSDESSKKTTRPKKKPKVTASRSKNEKPVSQKGVPAPRHKRQVSQNIGNEAANFFASNAEYLKATTNGDSERLKLLKRREVREDKQHGLMMEKGKAEVKLAEIETKLLVKF
ncbi:hypothetical protein P692DRAFT_20879011 [Suillus brevipes Sb2]|nr:hypothetical protein P692DRAFT_20879011 [Suillus brevipes Sb2]